MNRSTTLFALFAVATGAWSLLGYAPPAAAETLYGVTGTNLVTIDPTNPAHVTIVGPHFLPGGSLPFALAYDPHANRLIGSVSTGDLVDQRLYEFNRATGAATPLANLNDPGNVFSYESLEYVGGSLNQFVISRGPANNPPSADLYAVNPDSGALTFLTNNDRDNDYSVWDSLQSRFFTTDPNDHGQLTEVSLVTGANADRLNIFPSQGPGDMAFSVEHNAIFATDFDFRTDDPAFFRIDIDGSGNPTSITNVGDVSGDYVYSVAMVPEPQTAVLMALGIAMLLGSYRARRST